MAKELPYFKFFVSEWNDGDITLEDFEVQGLFINICSYYWSNGCEITLTKVKKKFRGYDKQIETLTEAKLIKVDDDNLTINFLDEQMTERLEKSHKNSESARKRWERIKKAEREESESDANALEAQCESDTIKRREEKKREDIPETTISDKIKSFDSENRNICNWFYTQLDDNAKKKITDKIKLSWCETIDKCNRIDEFDYPRIFDIVKFAKNDSFWGAQFMTINKLRTKKTGDDLTYIFRWDALLKKPVKTKPETYEQIVVRTQGNQKYNF